MREIHREATKCAKGEMHKEATEGRGVWKVRRQRVHIRSGCRSIGKVRNAKMDLFQKQIETNLFRPYIWEKVINYRGSTTYMGIESGYSFYSFLSFVVIWETDRKRGSRPIQL